jgi:cyclopropane fatty-acyl-phospholipid synthase-like methyltransferase
VLRAAYARHYKEGSDVWTADAAMRCVPSIVQGYLKLGPHTRVLDVGCGAGRDVAYFAALTDSVVGIDIYQHPAWPAIERSAGGRVRFDCTDLLAYDGPSGWDLVLDNGCFHHQHLDEAGAYLNKAAALLSRNGWFVLLTFLNPAKGSYVDPHGRLHRYVSDAELRRALGRAGMGIVHNIELYRGQPDDYYRLSFVQVSTRPSTQH